ncbi:MULTISPECIES: outer membrane protein assembly factor BamB [Corallincola]|uniref:Outer membrane protein assembly factor BamB n=3 Tax=Corallincola TaxID=1775176 RepID=A0A368NE78_9GAMM|nr:MULTISPECIES: outer membrane protein assembly factor BamB [Corallincola]RCU48798.1 outer membrane protein assembly factor BamB [Corallincola holothuriorum]TAA42695.1 outer membrane protein assembly factor BamB [Corallincola spongiicola]TCI01654.1 outer membrane protein assembly factor BamB [Corallincola luteus]
MRHLSKALLFAVSLVAVSGCSLFGDDDEIKIAELPDIEMQFEADVIWDYQVGDGVGEYYSRLRPAVAYGKLFAASRFGDVVAIDLESGYEVWQQDVTKRKPGWLFDERINAMISGGLTVRYKQLFFGTEKGRVISLDAETGEVLWDVEVDAEVLAPPTVDQSVVVVNTGSGKLFGLDSVSGKQLWSYQQELPSLTLRGVSSVAAAQGGIILGKANGKVAALSITNGIEYWEQEAAPPKSGSDLDRIVDVDADPVILAGTIYAVAYNGYLQALDIRSGRALWQREYSSYRGFSIDGFNLYLSDFQGHIYAIDRRTGLELWSNRDLENRGVTEPVPFGDYVVVGDFESYLHWLDPKSGALVSRIEVGDDGLYSSAVVDGDTLYVQSRDGTVSAVKMP